MTDGTYAPLFINKRQRIPIGEWLDAEDHPTKGFAHRPGWHCCASPVAPHLKRYPKNGRPRAWFKVEIEDFTYERRPAKQGGVWFLAQRMKVIRRLDGE